MSGSKVIKVKVKARKVYDLEIGGKIHKGFELISEHYGMLELKLGENTVICDKPLDVGFAEVFSLVFSSSDNSECEVSAFKMSPDLLPLKSKACDE